MDFIIMPELRLIFCHIEKVAGTQFQIFFRALHRAIAGRDTVPQVMFYDYGTLTHRQVTLEALRGYLADPTWYKAVFVREPVERFLSGLASKCSWNISTGAMMPRPRDGDGREQCREAFGSATMGLRGAVEKVRTSRHIPNRHWKPQHAFCGGLEGTLHHYQAVEVLRLSTTNERVHHVLRQVPAIASNVTVMKRAKGIANRVFKVNNSKAVQSVGAPKNHHTDAKSHAARVFAREPGGHELLTDVVMHYLRDYLLFGIPIPLWARGRMGLEDRVRWPVNARD